MKGRWGGKKGGGNKEFALGGNENECGGGLVREGGCRANKDFCFEVN